MSERGVAEEDGWKEPCAHVWERNEEGGRAGETHFKPERLLVH